MYINWHVEQKLGPGAEERPSLDAGHQEQP